MLKRWLTVTKFGPPPIYVALLAGVVLVGGLIYAVAAKSGKPGIYSLMPNEPYIVELGKTIYVAQCASCHGANLEGEPNWRRPNADLTMPAPPHDGTGHTWHHTDEVLFRLTKYGLAKYLNQQNYKSNMPVYEDVLTDDEIRAVLSYIKSRWSKEIRERHDQINKR